MQFDLSKLFGLTDKQQEAVKTIYSVYNDYQLDDGSASFSIDHVYNSETSDHDNFKDSLNDLYEAFSSITSDLSSFPSLQKIYHNDFCLPDDTDILYDENVDYDNLSDDERYDYESENKNKLAEIYDGLRDDIENFLCALEKRSEKLLNGFAVNEYLDTDNMQTLAEFLNQIIASKKCNFHNDELSFLHPASMLCSIAEKYPELNNLKDCNLSKIDLEHDYIKFDTDTNSINIYQKPGNLRMAIYAENNDHEVNTFQDLADHAFYFVSTDYSNSEDDYLLDDVLKPLVDTMGLVDQIYQDQIDLKPYLPQPELTVKKQKGRGL